MRQREGVIGVVALQVQGITRIEQTGLEHPLSIDGTRQRHHVVDRYHEGGLERGVMQVQRRVHEDALRLPADRQSPDDRILPQPAHGGQKGFLRISHALHEVLVIAIQLDVVDGIQRIGVVAVFEVGLRTVHAIDLEGFPQKGFARGIDDGVDVAGGRPHPDGKQRGYRR